MNEFIASSALAVEPPVIWEHAVNPADMNREFFPYCG